MDMASSTSMVGVEKVRRAGRKRPCALFLGYIQPYDIPFFVWLSSAGIRLSQASIRFGVTFFFGCFRFEIFRIQF
jgi:hypothetical protein